MKVEARETFRPYPDIVQWVLTIVSGKPLRSSRPKFWLTPVAAIAIDYAKYGSGVAGAGACYLAGGWWLSLLPLCWIVAVNGARSLASDAHYAGHGVVTGNRRLDQVLGDLISLSILALNMDDYSGPHNRGHHGRSGIGSTRDPDIAMMRLLGYETGRSLAYYKVRYLATLVSPRYHLLYTFNRLRSTFISAPRWRMVLAAACAATLAVVAQACGLWSLLTLAWVLPILPLYAVSAAMQFPSEHLWLAEKTPGESQAEYLKRVSHGRFFILPKPDTAWGWVGWSARMVPLALGRFSVCVSILPAHDYHHGYGTTKDWPMEPWLRQRAVEDGARFTDYCGLYEPTMQLFRVWASLPKGTVTPQVNFLAWIERMFGRSIC